MLYKNGIIIIIIIIIITIIIVIIILKLSSPLKELLRDNETKNNLDGT